MVIMTGLLMLKGCGGRCTWDMHVLLRFKQHPQMVGPLKSGPRARKVQMELEGLKCRVWWLVVVMIIHKVAECRQPVLHRIGGGRSTWAPRINFTQWSSEERFYVGDWLYFGFDKRIYNVLEVNSTSYENCVDKDFIYNITRGGRDVFNLTKAKTYFFLSGRGYCFEGMKVAILVQEIPPEPLLPNSANGFQSYVYSHITLLAMLAIAASAWTFPY